MLKKNRRGQGVHVRLAASGGASLFSNGGECAGRAHALIPHFMGQAGAASHGGCHFPGRDRAVPLGTLERKRKTDDESYGIVQGDELEEAGHGEALAFPALQGLQRGGEDLGLVAEGEADPELTPVERQQSSGGWNGLTHRKSVNGRR